MKFVATIEIEVADIDADIMRIFPDVIQDRFAGTAVKIPHILVERKDS